MTAPTEVSAAIRLQSGKVALISNETGVWLAPSIERANEAVRLSVPSLPEDPEGACVADDGSVWIVGSHSNGKVDREALCHYSPDLRLLHARYNLKAMIRAESAWAFLRPFLPVINIEGLAFARGAIIVGLRAPLIDGKAILLRIGAPNSKQLVGGRNDLSYSLVNLSGLGVRDLAANDSRIIISAGGSIDGKAQFHLRAVRSDTLALTSLDLPLPKSFHWEAILADGKITLLADADSGAPPIYTPPAGI